MLVAAAAVFAPSIRSALRASDGGTRAYRDRNGSEGGWTAPNIGWQDAPLIDDDDDDGERDNAPSQQEKVRVAKKPTKE